MFCFSFFFSSWSSFEFWSKISDQDLNLQDALCLVWFFTLISFRSLTDSSTASFFLENFHLWRISFKSPKSCAKKTINEIATGIFLSWRQTLIWEHTLRQTKHPLYHPVFRKTKKGWHFLEKILREVFSLLHYFDKKFCKLSHWFWKYFLSSLQ